LTMGNIGKTGKKEVPQKKILWLEKNRPKIVVTWEKNHQTRDRGKNDSTEAGPAQLAKRQKLSTWGKKKKEKGHLFKL